MVRWLIIAIFVGIAGVRYLAYKSEQIILVPGMRVRAEITVEDPTRLKVGNILIRVPENVQVEFGDRVMVEGEVVKYYLKIEKFEIIQTGSGFRRVVDWLRQASAKKWQKWLPSNEAALAQGILLGGTEMFTDKAEIDFRRVGISHIVAASGFNVMVVAGWVSLLGMRLFGRRLSIPFVIVCISMYTLLAGFNPPVVRAGIMAIISAVGLLLGRKTDSVWLLMITGAGMVIYKPEWLTSVSWQLSMGAMVAMLGVANWLKGLRWPLSDLFITLAVNAMTLPIILFWFGTISLVAPLANVLVLWAVPVVMQLTAVATLMGIISYDLGQVGAWLSWPGLRWITWVSEKLAAWPDASRDVGKIDMIWVLTYYILGYVLIYMWRRRASGR